MKNMELPKNDFSSNLNFVFKKIRSFDMINNPFQLGVKHGFEGQPKTQLYD
jgi:hypothetical protein